MAGLEPQPGVHAPYLRRCGGTGEERVELRLGERLVPEHVGERGQRRRPQLVAERQQVDGEELAEAEQVTLTVAGGQLAVVLDERLAQPGREVASVDWLGDRIGRRGPLPPRRGHSLDGAEQIGAELGGQVAHRDGDVVGIDLVAGEEQLLRATLHLTPAVADQGVEGREHVGAIGVGTPARPVGETQSVELGRRHDERRQ